MIKHISTSQPKKIAVIGAGISGLTAAYTLHKQGYPVTIYERESAVGGRMSTREKDGFAFDTGANHLAKVYTHMQELARELGLDFVPVEFLEYRVIKNGKPIGLLESIGNWQKIKLGAASFLGSKKTGEFFDFSTVANYDADNAERFFKTRVGQTTLDYLIDPFVSTYQFHRANEMSMGGVYAMMRSQRRDTEDWKLHHLRGGMIALCTAMADKLDVRTSTPVSHVRPVANRVEIVVQNKVKRYDAAILATTADIALKIYRDATPMQHQLLEQTKYASTIAVAFKIPATALEGITIVWVPYVEGGAISGYTNEAMKGHELIKNDKTLLITWFHESFARAIIDKTDKEIFEIAKNELLKVCPYITDPSMVESHDLQRWPAAMPKFSEGHLSRVKTFLGHGQGEQNVYLCGDYLNAPWTEGALRCGERVANMVDEKLSMSVKK